MEHVRGETLAARLRRGPLPFNEAITIALQVADALGAAHAKGIVHRDLKPENIMITPAGAKVLDFGLAKMDPPVVVSDSTVTESRALTTEGTIIGTLAYMAPEQMEGKDCDSRTDVFAFGLVLYEMVTGRRAFPQESKAGLIAAVMASHPDFTPIQNLEKPHFERVLRGCVDKQPSSRWQNILDVKRLLEWPADAPAAPAARDRSGRWWLRGLAAAGILAGVLGGVAYLRRAPEPVTPSESADFPRELRGSRHRDAGSFSRRPPTRVSRASIPAAFPRYGFTASTPILPPHFPGRTAPEPPSGRPMAAGSDSIPMES